MYKLHWVSGSKFFYFEPTYWWHKNCFPSRQLSASFCDALLSIRKTRGSLLEAVAAKLVYTCPKTLFVTKNYIRNSDNGGKDFSVTSGAVSPIHISHFFSVYMYFRTIYYSSSFCTTWKSRLSSKETHLQRFLGYVLFWSRQNCWYACRKFQRRLLVWWISYLQNG
jgi:hypothetical protein